jgi:uncharacterized cofD-like protein
MGEMEDGSIVEGEHSITSYRGKIKKIYYKNEPKVSRDAIKAIKQADLIVLSMGSIYTSIVPNLICKEIINAIDSSSANLMYICNIVTQPGETDDFKVSDHVKTLNRYLGKRKINYVIANIGEIDKSLAEKYATEEQKDPIELDLQQTEKLGVQVITDNLVYIKMDAEHQKNVFRHNYVKLGFLINTIALNYAYMLHNKEKNK